MLDNLSEGEILQAVKLFLKFVVVGEMWKSTSTSVEEGLLGEVA